MKISKQARRDAKQLFRSSFVSGLLDDLRALKVVKLLIEKKPRGYVGIISHFQRLVKLDIERRAAKVESAVQLSPSVQENIKGNLTKRYGQGLNISFAQDASLIGGLRVKVGSDVYDGSVKAKLAELAESF